MKFGSKIISFESIDSTNRYGKDVLAHEEEGTVILAAHQTAGRGRLGRSWTSEGGSNLTFSLLMKPNLPADQIGWISLFAGLSICRALEQLTGVRPECKWPNDVLLSRKKCCGILAESSIVGSRCTGIVLGIGLNVNQREFPDEISATATSMALVTGRTYELRPVLSAVLASLQEGYTAVRDGAFDGVHAGWASYATMMGRPVTVTTPEGVREGIAERIDPTARLVVRHGNIEATYSAGDVSVRYDGAIPRS